MVLPEVTTIIVKRRSRLLHALISLTVLEPTPKRQARSPTVLGGADEWAYDSLRRGASAPGPGSLFPASYVLGLACQLVSETWQNPSQFIAALSLIVNMRVPLQPLGTLSLAATVAAFLLALPTCSAAARCIT